MGLPFLINEREKMICSLVKKIDSLYFRPVRNGQVIRNANVVMLDRGGFIIESKTGILYTNMSIAKGAYGMGMWYWTKTVMKGLVKMKIITKKDMEIHVTECEKRQKESSLRHSADMVTDHCKRLGIKLNKADKKKVKKYLE